MYFKRIDMHGFKSFAEPVSIDFHEGITCIVGPNGSGKSNISDAIRWVLGEQSPKTLRGGKMEEVIFAGTASRKSRGMAEVTLVVDNSRGILPIDYAEVAITRRMYRSGESEYFINSSSCRLKDIRELIMDTGIGVEGYSIIGQGRISDIVSGKPESRREIFEEAAGIVKYRSKKSEAERKLESTNHNLERVNDVAAEIESRIDRLREDSEKASEFLVLRDRCKTIDINITLKNIESLELKNEYMKDDLLELDGQIDHVRDQKTAFDEDIAGNRARSEELDREGIAARDQLLELVESIGALTNQKQLRQEKMAAIDREETRLIDEIDGIGIKRAKEAASRAELAASGEEAEISIARLAEALADRTQAHEEAMRMLTAQIEETESRKNRIYELHALTIEKNAETASLASLCETLDRRREQIEEEKAAGMALSDDAEARKAQAVGKAAEIHAAAGAIDAQLAENTARMMESGRREAEALRDLQALRVRHGEASARKRLIEELEKSYEGYNNAVKFVMKNIGAMDGIHGVVADLIEVPAGYEVAVETALGAALQNVVCADDDSARQAIDKLKVNKAGRLTFLPVQSIRQQKPQTASAFEKAVGFKGIGVDCVKFDMKYAGIMNYLLGRVIIVDRLEHAIRLSKDSTAGLRYVTLEGEVINASGAITGGNYKTSGPNLLERKSEIRKLDEQVTSLARAIADGEASLQSLADARAAMAETAAALAERKRALEMELLHAENASRAAESQLSDLAGQAMKQDRELDSIRRELETSGVLIGELTAAVQAAAAEIAALEQQADAGLQQQGDRKTMTDELMADINETRLALSAAESERGRIRSLTARIDAYLEELDQEQDARTARLSELRDSKAAIQEKDAELSVVIREKEEEKSGREDYLRANQNEKELIQNYLREVTGKRQSMDEQLNGLQTQKYELDLKLARNEAQVDGYKEKLWEEFEISYIQAVDFKHHDFNMAAAQRESRELRGRIKELGEVNIGAIREYETVRERYEFLTTQRQDLLEAIAALRRIIEDMDRTIRANFKESFEKISENFESAFVELFGGGTAALRLEDETRPLECGIEIVAQPPGKKLQNINLLSGGEKTMTAIALMFAVLKAKPTPFCILDEVEAALDDANINRFAEYLKTFRDIQFTLVTHQKATMEYADVLYGVTMPEQGISKVLSLKLAGLAG